MDNWTAPHDFYDYGMDLEDSTLPDFEMVPYEPYQTDTSFGDRVTSFLVEYLLAAVHNILCIFVIGGSILFFYVMYKFKRLRTRTNYILLNFLICATSVSVCKTVVSVIEFYFLYMAPFYFYALLFVLLDLSFFMALLLAIDWFLSANCSRVFEIYRKIYKWLIIGIYFMMNFIVVLVYFTSFTFHFNTLLSMLLYLIIILIIMAFNIVKSRKTYTQEALQTAYALSISNIFMLMWFPLITSIGLLKVLSPLVILFKVRHIIAITFPLLNVITVCSPLVIVISLGRMDKRFKMSFDYVFRRSVRNYAQSIGDVEADEDSDNEDRE